MVRRKDSRIQGDDFRAIIAQTLLASFGKHGAERLTYSALPHEQFPKKGTLIILYSSHSTATTFESMISMQSSMGCVHASGKFPRQDRGTRHFVS